MTNEPDVSVVRVSRNAFHLALRDVFVGFTRRWRKVQASKLDAIQEHALQSLKEAGLVELRRGVDVRWVGYPYLLQSIFEVCGENTDEMLDRELSGLIRLAPGWNDEEIPLAEESPETALRIQTFPMAARLSDRGVVLNQPEYPPAEILQMMELLTEGKLPPAPPSVDLIDWTTFVPSSLQRSIWVALDGRALTADKLEEIAARSTLFKKVGGLPEMIDLKLIRNDRQRGGYYRPDSAPKI